MKLTRRAMADQSRLSQDYLDWVSPPVISSSPVRDPTQTMNWYNYVSCFFAPAFLANIVPPFHGISGDRFPTPFAKPPGRGLSSQTVNVVWALRCQFSDGRIVRCSQAADRSAQSSFLLTVRTLCHLCRPCGGGSSPDFVIRFDVLPGSSSWPDSSLAESRLIRT